MATNIRFLGLERNKLTDKFAHFLHGNILCCGAQPPMLYLLETLYVSDNPITEDGMHAIICGVEDQWGDGYWCDFQLVFAGTLVPEDGWRFKRHLYSNAHGRWTWSENVDYVPWDWAMRDRGDPAPTPLLSLSP